VLTEERDEMYDSVEETASSIEGRLDDWNSTDNGIFDLRFAKAHSVGRKKIHMARGRRVELTINMEGMVFKVQCKEMYSIQY